MRVRLNPPLGTGSDESVRVYADDGTDLITDLRHLVELATSELRDLARSGWSSVAERHAIELARDIDEKLARLTDPKP